MYGRAVVGERRQRRALIEPEDVLDGVVAAWGPAMREHVGADLREGGLEQHEVAVVWRSTGRLAQLLDRRVENFQTVVKVVEGGVELKGRQDG